MGIGPTVRKQLENLGIPATDLFRSAFIDLDAFTATVTSLCRPARILEIGCGDGSCAQRLLAALPEATYLGIDIAPEPGGLFQGDRSRADFRSVASDKVVAEGPEPFDLVLVVDVLHHVPAGQRAALLRDAAHLTAPGGMLMVKEWERRPGLAHAAAYGADRYLSGDRGVAFGTRDEWAAFLAEVLPHFTVGCETRVPPRRNNILWALRTTV